MPKSKLKPCPKCGEVPEIGYACGEYFIFHPSKIVGTCVCSSFSEMHSSEGLEIEAWNRIAEGGLKPCPFCGGEAVLYHQSSKYTDYDGDYVHCMKCGCRTRLFECFNGTGKTHEDTEKEAMKAWNRRADNERRRDGKI